MQGRRRSRLTPHDYHLQEQSGEPGTSLCAFHQGHLWEPDEYGWVRSPHPPTSSACLCRATSKWNLTQSSNSRSWSGDSYLYGQHCPSGYCKSLLQKGIVFNHNYLLWVTTQGDKDKSDCRSIITVLARKEGKHLKKLRSTFAKNHMPVKKPQKKQNSMLCALKSICKF